MSRAYLTIKDYSKKYKVPKSTIRAWIKDGQLEARTDIRPVLIPDDQKVPTRRKNAWKYEWEES